MAGLKRLREEIVEMHQAGSIAAEIADKLWIPKDWVWQVYDEMEESEYDDCLDNY